MEILDIVGGITNKTLLSSINLLICYITGDEVNFPLCLPRWPTKLRIMFSIIKDEEMGLPKSKAAPLSFIYGPLPS